MTKLGFTKTYPKHVDERLIELVNDVPVSFSEAANIISKEFKLHYTRCQLIGRYNRLKRIRGVPHLDADWSKRMTQVQHPKDVR